MAAETSGVDLIPAVALLGAGVVAVPIFKRVGLGSVLGYLAAGIAIGPFGLRLFTEPAGDPQRRRARRRHVPVRHRAGDEAVAAVGAPRATSSGSASRRSSLCGVAARPRAGMAVGAGFAGRASSRRWASCSPRPRSSCRSSRSAARRPTPHGQQDLRRSCCSRISRSCRCWPSSRFLAPVGAEAATASRWRSRSSSRSAPSPA